MLCPALQGQRTLLLPPVELIRESSENGREWSVKRASCKGSHRSMQAKICAINISRVQARRNTAVAPECRTCSGASELHAVSGMWERHARAHEA